MPLCTYVRAPEMRTFGPVGVALPGEKITYGTRMSVPAMATTRTIASTIPSAIVQPRDAVDLGGSTGGGATGASGGVGEAIGRGQIATWTPRAARGPRSAMRRAAAPR